MRYVPYIYLSSKSESVTITLSGCNFKCRHCLSPAQKLIGKPMSCKELMGFIDLSIECCGISPKVAWITGGEPTLDRDFLLDLISGLEGRMEHIMISTNGYLLSVAIALRQSKSLEQ